MRGMVWNNIQLGTAITCACLPTYRPLLLKCIMFFPSIISSRYSSFRFPPSFCHFPNIRRPQISSAPYEPECESQFDLIQLLHRSHQFWPCLDNHFMPTLLKYGSGDERAGENPRNGKKVPLHPILVNDAVDLVWNNYYWCFRNMVCFLLLLALSQ